MDILLFTQIKKKKFKTKGFFWQLFTSGTSLLLSLLECLEMPPPTPLLIKNKRKNREKKKNMESTVHLTVIICNGILYMYEV